MDREYDLFEKLFDGSVVWRRFVRGLETARAKLGEFASRSKNEFFAIHTPTKDIVERVNLQPQVCQEGTNTMSRRAFSVPPGIVDPEPA
jgi:hypothetical protein